MRLVWTKVLPKTVEWVDINPIIKDVLHYSGITNGHFTTSDPAIYPVDTEYAFDIVKSWTYKEDDDRRLDTGYSNIFGIREKMQKGIPMPPVLLKDGKIVDGKHRIVAAWSLGITYVPAVNVEDVVKENITEIVKPKKSKAEYLTELKTQSDALYDLHKTLKILQSQYNALRYEYLDSLKENK